MSDQHQCCTRVSGHEPLLLAEETSPQAMVSHSCNPLLVLRVVPAVASQHPEDEPGGAAHDATDHSAVDTTTRCLRGRRERRRRWRGERDDRDGFDRDSQCCGRCRGGAKAGRERGQHGRGSDGGRHCNGGGDDDGGGGHRDGDERRIDASGGGDALLQAGGVGVVTHAAAGCDREYDGFGRR